MNTKDLEQIIAQGENYYIEFKSWKRSKDFKSRMNLTVDEVIAFANAKGGTVFLGIEDSGEITGCDECDVQSIIESIYDKTRPPIFTDVEKIYYNDDLIYAISVSPDGAIHSTTDGRFLRRLGKNSKPFYPVEMATTYTIAQGGDFSGLVIEESSLEDINMLEVYNLKEKIKIRDTNSTLPELDDLAFLRDLGLIKHNKETEKLTIAGLLFVGKESSIKQLLPQAEVIYLHYGDANLEEYDLRLDMKLPLISVLDKLTDIIASNNKITNIQIGLFRLEVSDFSQKVFQEALLNALSHRDYQNNGSIYVKHYPHQIIIESPGSFLEGITPENIITHPSVPRNKLIAETLQRLKYVQRTGQGVDIIYKEMLSMGKPYPQYQVHNDAVKLILNNSMDSKSFVKFIISQQEFNQKAFSLSELMILRYLLDNKRISLSNASKLTQVHKDELRRNFQYLSKIGLIEYSGKEYMFTAKSYAQLKSDVEYSQDKTIQYLKAKNLITDYLKTNNYITNQKIRDLCGYTKQQARNTIDKMKQEELLLQIGKGSATKYMLNPN